MFEKFVFTLAIAVMCVSGLLVYRFGMRFGAELTRNRALKDAGIESDAPVRRALPLLVSFVVFVASTLVVVSR